MTNLQDDQQALADRLGLNELCISQFISYGRIKVSYFISLNYATNYFNQYQLLI